MGLVYHEFIVKGESLSGIVKYFRSEFPMLDKRQRGNELEMVRAVLDSSLEERVGRRNKGFRSLLTNHQRSPSAAHRAAYQYGRERLDQTEGRV